MNVPISISGTTCVFDLFDPVQIWRSNQNSHAPDWQGTTLSCVGILSDKIITVQTVLHRQPTILPCTVLTVHLESIGSVSETSFTPCPMDTLCVTRRALELAMLTAPSTTLKPGFLTALCIRTRHAAAQTAGFSVEAMDWILGHGVHHLLVDQPSLDLHGLTSQCSMNQARAAMFGLTRSQSPVAASLNAAHNTFTCSIFVPPQVKDGIYMINLAPGSFHCARVPAAPVLHTIRGAGFDASHVDDVPGAASSWWHESSGEAPTVPLPEVPQPAPEPAWRHRPEPALNQRPEPAVRQGPAPEAAQRPGLAFSDAPQHAPEPVVQPPEMGQKVTFSEELEDHAELEDGPEEQEDVREWHWEQDGQETEAGVEQGWAPGTGAMEPSDLYNQMPASESSYAEMLASPSWQDSDTLSRILAIRNRSSALASASENAPDEIPVRLSLIHI
eukprot:TRINITY_DN28416_c0_g1_i1.p1 TRINITY_DN28416_c0_g1~~TRINITY_DN28416_c0_g1_i1.p1  ORF type:complete len:444 (+),score=74.56 TRINITY_DN28416_c0_g1_i1:191-1522(+)